MNETTDQNVSKSEDHSWDLGFAFEMYSTKTIHKNINPNYKQAYISIGDPYKTTQDQLPSRWKQKQLYTQSHPQNAHCGYFSKLVYHNEEYLENTEKYTKTQPLDKRKLGFGSHDAFKRGEFTSTKATERYRDVLRNEAKLLSKQVSTSLKLDIPQKITREPPKDKFGRPLQEPSFLYDIGRSQVTPYTPNSSHDSFYKVPKHAPVNPGLKGKDPIRRLGSHRPMSASYGERAWSHKYEKPEHGTVSFVEKFYDRGHIECKGF